MWHFLNDENMVVRGLLIGTLNDKVRQIWFNIPKNHHRLVVSPQLYEKYLEKLDEHWQRAASIEIASTMLAIIRDMQFNSELTIMFEPTGKPSPWQGVIRDVDDWFLADLAYEITQAGVIPNLVLVTTDRATRENFNRPPLAARNIQGVTIEVGLALSAQDDTHDGAIGQ